MKKSSVFLIIGCVMVVGAIAFVMYALNHPEQSFPWSNGITYFIYAVYLLVTIGVFSCLQNQKKLGNNPFALR